MAECAPYSPGVASWSDVNHLIQNFALLIAGVTVLTFTYPAQGRQRSAQLALRYAGFVALGLYLMVNGLTLPDGLRFDFRAVVVALVAWRYGMLPALLVALPLAAYRTLLGGHGVGVAVIHLALVALIAGRPAGWLQLEREFHEAPLRRRWWSPFALFATVNLIFFPALLLTGHPLSEALSLYATTTLLSAVGLFLAYDVKHSRLRTLAYAAHFEQLAASDSLTGCFNRRQFDADLDTVREPAFLLLLDIDHFKRVNDTYGHEAGDRVLVALADTLRVTARAKDRVYRVGGEEFAVLYPDASFEEAGQAAERLRRAVETTLATRAGLPGEGLTVSGGLVPFQGDRQGTLHAADQHLYAAKQAGRNCIRSSALTG